VLVENYVRLLLQIMNMLLGIIFSHLILVWQVECCPASVMTICNQCDRFTAECTTTNELVPQHLPKGIRNIKLTYIGKMSRLRLKDLHRFLDLERLAISGNIDSIDEDTFSLTRKLISLNLTGTQINWLPDRVFEKITLYKLNLAGNLFPEFPTNTFQPLTKLTVLDLSKNPITSFCNGSMKYPSLQNEFSSLESLQTLLLDEVAIPATCPPNTPPYVLKDNMFSPLYGLNITRLSIGGNYFSFPFHPHHSWTFRELINLRSLNISSIYRFVRCPKAVMDILLDLPVSLAELYMENWENSIPIRPECVLDTSAMAQFLNHKNLTFISFRGSDRVFGTQMRSGLFKHLASLKTLDLTGIRAVDIMDGTFDPIRSLHKLILDRNPLGNRQFFLRSKTLNKTGVLLRELSLSNICDCSGQPYQLYYIFDSYPALEYINLSHNNFHYMPIFLRIDSTTVTTRITHLILNNNDIPSLSSADMSFLFPNLSVFDAFNNKLTDIGNLTMKKGGELLLGKNLLGNNMNRLCMTLASMTGLKTLDLSANQIADPSCLSLMSQWDVLDTLNLSDNSVKDIHSLFQGEKRFKIRHLDLSHNRIAAIKPGSFMALDPKYLETLILSFNQLTELPKDFVSVVSSQYLNLQRLDICGNPLACGCNMNWFSKWLQTTSVVPNAITIPCHDSGTAIASYSQDQFTCIWMWFLIALAGTVGTVLVAVPCYIYRWYVSNLRFVISSMLSFAKELREDNKIVYDAFVSYDTDNERDSTWVNTELLPNTEGFSKVCQTKILVHFMSFSFSSGLSFFIHHYGIRNSTMSSD